MKPPSDLGVITTLGVTGDSGVIAKFTGGTFISRDGKLLDPDGNEIPDSGLTNWVPAAGVELRYFRLPQDEGGAKPYVKVRFSDPMYPYIEAAERAIYRVEGETLMAQNIELASGFLLLSETLTLTPPSGDKEGEMRHDLEFSNGVKALWICRLPK